MPVTFCVASHNANEISKVGRRSFVSSQGILDALWQSNENTCKELLQSSFDNTASSELVTSNNGFIKGVLQAYNQHHHLVIRPDDIWIAILTQFNAYVNAHAEDLRSTFVAHEGKRELEIRTFGTPYTIDFGAMAAQFGKLLEQNVIDSDLRDWIIPQFSTTTNNDIIICSTIMMSTLKQYFSYKLHTMCGIPSITLQGEKADYQAIQQKLNKLEQYGVEPTAFACLLRPVIAQFVEAFDTIGKGGKPDPDFWGRICHYKTGGSGPTYLGGWISAFGVWDEKGKWQGPELSIMHDDLTDQEKSEDHWFGPPPPLVYAGVRYPVIDTADIPKGYCEVDVKLDNNGENFDCIMIAGHVGSKASEGDHGVINTLQPAAGWFIFVKGEAPLGTTSRFGT